MQAMNHLQPSTSNSCIIVLRLLPWSCEDESRPPRRLSKVLQYLFVMVGLHLNYLSKSLFFLLFLCLCIILQFLPCLWALLCFCFILLLLPFSFLCFLLFLLFLFLFPVERHIFLIFLFLPVLCPHLWLILLFCLHLIDALASLEPTQVGQWVGGSVIVSNSEQ